MPAHPKPETIRKPLPVVTSRRPIHSMTGEIVKLSSSLFTLRLRSGRTIVVDASAALDSGRYSAPLFVGKLVVVQGKFDSRGIMLGDVVTRVTQIDPTTPVDR